MATSFKTRVIEEERMPQSHLHTERLYIAHHWKHALTLSLTAAMLEELQLNRAGQWWPLFPVLSNYQLDNQSDLSHLRREELPPRKRCLISHGRGGWQERGHSPNCAFYSLGSNETVQAKVSLSLSLFFFLFFLTQLIWCLIGRSESSGRLEQTKLPSQLINFTEI